MENSKFGSAMGSGNPPGKHSDSYLDMPTQGSGHFVANKNYRSDMHVGMPGGMPIVGNQPQDRSEGSINWTGKPSLRK